MSSPRKTRKKYRSAGLSRREFLRRSSAASLAAAVPLLGACRSSAPVAAEPARVFQHGVASGDPLTDRIVLWTRVSPPAGGMPVGVVARMYRDAALTQPAGVMDASTDSQRDYTVKIDFAGLTPGTTYYYTFEALGETSPVGRTRTAPTGAASNLRLGVVSCSSYAHGYFNAYALLAKRADIDVVLHLGDYIYEYGTGEYGTVRPYEPAHEMVSLADYRTRHAYYKRDPDLMELHRQHPFITTWDDHESTDNSWRDGAVNHTEGAEGSWPQRKAWAQQAYDEWMPIRYPQSGNRARIWRRFSYGGLLDLFILDTRLYDRDEPGGIPASESDGIKDPERRLLGPEQMQWLQDGLVSSTATWKVIGQQVVMHQWQLVGAPQSAGGGQQLNGDSWDGYQAERQALIDHLRGNGINNVVVLTGDVHSSWAADLSDDPNNPAAYNPATGAGAVATEFVTTSVTSPFAIDIPDGQQAFLANNPHIRYTDWDRKGYLLLDLTPERAQGEWWYVSTFTEPGGSESFGAGYRTSAGSNHLEITPVTEPAAPPADAPPLAPAAN